MLELAWFKSLRLLRLQFWSLLLLFEVDILLHSAPAANHSQTTAKPPEHASVLVSLPLGEQGTKKERRLCF